MNMIKLFLLKARNETLYVKGMNKVLKEIITSSPFNKKKISGNLEITQSLFSKWINTNVSIPILLFSRFQKLSQEIDFLNFLSLSTRGGNGVRSGKIPAILTTDLAYLIGQLTGDGCLYSKSYTIVLCLKKGRDKNVISIFREEFGIPVKVNNHGNWSELRINCKPLHLFLRHIFELPLGKKKGKLAVPTIIKDSNPRIKLAFIRGFFDADGCLCKTHKTYSIMFKQSTRNFLTELKEMLKEFGVEIGGPYFDKQNKSWLLGTWRKEVVNKLSNLLTSAAVVQPGRRLRPSIEPEESL